MSVEVDYAARSADRLALDTSSDSKSRPSRSVMQIIFGIVFTKKNSLILFVMFPAILAAIYYFLIASNQYVTETRMVVRTIGVSERFDTSEKRGGQSIIGGDSLTQDSYILANYLQSPEIVGKLEAQIGLSNLFSKDETDIISRLPHNAAFEELHAYWLRHIDTYVDGPSGVIVFKVRAFSPEDAVLISKTALNASNEMINKISEKARTDLVGRGEHDMVVSLSDYQGALVELRDYQNKTGILDPISSARMTNAVISKLTEEKLKLDVSLRSLEAAKADDTVNGRQLRRSIQALNDEIQLRQNSLAGTSAAPGELQLSSSMTEFARLETRRIVTQALYESTVRNLDTAKSTALKRTTFLSIFSDSHLPEKSEYPARFSQWLIFAAGLFTLWMTATLIWMSIEDHRV